MASGRRGTATVTMKENARDKDAVIVIEDNSSLESEIAQLRGRWELASVLNFLTVFESVIGGDLKLTAEEIETGLVKPDSSLAQLHIKLLKGIPPVSKTLNGTDAWVTALCKKIALWWPWVAEGEMPLTAANGEEMLRYRELNPTNRLQILKALCEIRAEQDDAVSYINDSLKSGIEICCFRKDKIGGDGNTTSYWCDGGTGIGHRLYKEVKRTAPKTKMKGKVSNSLPISLQWETLATNLDEFRKVVDELSSSKVVGEVTVGKNIETNFLPIVEKLQKKKERALKQKQRQERLLNDCRSYGTGITRSCRSRRPINYTFDDYDRAIDEAIEITKKMKTIKEQKNEKRHVKQGKFASDGSDMDVDLKENHTETDSDMGTDSKDENIKKDDFLDSETESDWFEPDDNGDDSKSDSEADTENQLGNCSEKQKNLGDRIGSQKPFGSRWSLRLAGVSHPVTGTRNLAAKNRLRQRPTCNSALNSIVLDSEDENLSENTNGETSEQEDLSQVANSEDFSDG